jgi:hypothetical protein
MEIVIKLSQMVELDRDNVKVDIGFVHFICLCGLVFIGELNEVEFGNLTYENKKVAVLRIAICVISLYFCTFS